MTLLFIYALHVHTNYHRNERATGLALEEALYLYVAIYPSDDLVPTGASHLDLYLMYCSGRHESRGQFRTFILQSPTTDVFVHRLLFP